ncbi:MAG: hypothetical protein CMJ49_11245 [Planctomycetaceae bacterium]|nr:hypothetical protein [Planctomycetaceae bacterium]
MTIRLAFGCTYRLKRDRRGSNLPPQMRKPNRLGSLDLGPPKLLAQRADLLMELSIAMRFMQTLRSHDQQTTEEAGEDDGHGDEFAEHQ